MSDMSQGAGRHGGRGDRAPEGSLPGSPAPLPAGTLAQSEAVYAIIEDVIHTSDVHPAFVAALGQRMRPPDGPHWLHLPILCCQAVGGDPDQGAVVAGAFELARLAADVLDDVEDADAGGALWESMGIPQATNVGTGLIFASLLTLSCLHECGAKPETVTLLQTEFARTGLHMCAGQHLDLCWGAGEPGSTGGKMASGENRPFTPAPQHPGSPAQGAPPHPRTPAPLHKYWQVVAAKSGAFFALGCRAGALLGGIAQGEVAPYAEYGHHLGLLAQTTNDLAGLLDEQGSSDLVQRKPTLPVIYAFAVADEPRRERLSRAWADAAHDAQARQDVRRLVIDLGAAHYVFVEAERHYQRARRALEQTGGRPDAVAQLMALLDQHRPRSFIPMNPVLSAVEATSRSCRGGPVEGAWSGPGLVEGGCKGGNLRLC